MAYTLRYSEDATNILERLDKQVATRIYNKMIALAAAGDIVQHKALRGQWKGYYKVRIDPFRVIYRIEREMQLLVVEYIGKRDDVYDQ